MQNSSPLVALIIEQYRNVRTERLATEISGRVLWVGMIVLVALFPSITLLRVVEIGVASNILFIMIQLKLFRLAQRESVIRETLARMDDSEHQDIYVRLMHDRSIRPVYLPGSILRSEHIIWLAALMILMAYRFIGTF